MAGIFGVPRKIKKELASELHGKNSSEYRATLEFIKELSPPFFSYKGFFGGTPFLSRALSYLPKVGEVFTPPDPFSKIKPDVNLKVAFGSDIFPNQKEAQKHFNSLKFTDVFGRPDKNHKIEVKHFRQLQDVANERGFGTKSLNNAFVSSPEIRSKWGKNETINVNPYNPRPIGAHKLMKQGQTIPDKLESVLKKFDDKEQAMLLKRFDFSKTNLTREDFTKLEKLANSHGLDVYKDLKVEPAKVKTEKIDNNRFVKLIVEASRDNKPLDLKGMNIKNCDMEVCFRRAESQLAQQGKQLNGLRIQGSELLGAKVSKFQLDVLNKLLTERTPPQPALDNKQIAVVGAKREFTLRAVEKAAASIMDFIGQTQGFTQKLKAQDMARAMDKEGVASWVR